MIGKTEENEDIEHGGDVIEVEVTPVDHFNNARFV